MRKKAQFGQVISGYVDPTPEGLNKAYQRHMDNLIAFEGLRQQANMLKSTNFEGDVAMRRELLQKTEGALNQIVDKAAYGNLSNFSAAAYRASSEYKKRAAPIETNYKLYQDYQAGVNKLLEDGKIDVEDAQGALMLSGMGYKGLGYDENGEVTGYFSGKQVWQKPEMQDMINKALTNIAPDEFRTVRTILEYGPDGSVTLDTDQGIKRISAEKVNAALNGIMNSKEVLGYYQRKGEIRTAGMDDAQIQEFLGDLQEGFGEYKDGKGNVDPRYQGKISSIQKAIDTQDPAKMRAEAVRQIQQSSLDTWRDAAVSGNAFESRTDIQKKRFSAKFMADYKNGLSSAASAGALTITDDGIKLKTTAGMSGGDMYKLIKEKEDVAAALQQKLNDKGADMSPEQRAALTTQVKAAERQVRMQRDAFTQLFNQTPEDVLNSPEWREKKERLLDWRLKRSQLHPWNPARFLDEWWNGDYDTEREEAEMFDEIAEFLDEKGLVNPNPEDTYYNIDYVNPTVLGAPKSTVQEVKNHFAGGFDSDQIVIDPNSGEAVTIDELYKVSDLTGVDIQDVRVSSTTPIGVGATMKVNFTYGEDGERGEVIIPINNINPDAEANSGLSMPALDDYLRSPSMSIVNEALTAREAYGASSWGPHPWAGVDPESGEVITGTLTCDFTTDSRGGTVTITRSNGETTKVDLMDNSTNGFHDMLNEMGITLY